MKSGLSSNTCVNLFLGKYSESLNVKDHLTSCRDIYREGITKVSIGNVHKLWVKYLDCLIEAYRLKMSDVVKTKLREAFEEAEYAEKIDGSVFILERQYPLWMEVASDKQESLEISEKGGYSF